MKGGILRCTLTLMLVLPSSGTTAVAGTAETGVKHIVLCWLKEPDNPQHRRQVIDDALALRAIPGINAIVVGRPLPSDRSIVDDSFDIGLVMSFTDAAAMQAYLQHPEHVTKVERSFRPLCGRIQVYDISY